MKCTSQANNVLRKILDAPYKAFAMKKHTS